MKQSFPNYVYIPRGRRNLSELTFRLKKTEILQELENRELKGRGVKFLMCTSDKKYLFGKNHRGELVQYSTRSKKLVEQHGKITHEYGDFVITNYPLNKSKIEMLIEFKNVSDTEGIEKLNLNEEKKLTKEMLEAQIILGYYDAYDQGWANEKGTFLFHINDTVLHCQRPIGKSIKREFQIYLEDASATKDDTICNKHSASGNCRYELFVVNIQFFTIPYLYVLPKGTFSFEFGIIGDKNC